MAPVPAYHGKMVFAVPAVSGQYAQDTFGLLGFPTQAGGGGQRSIMSLTVNVTALISGSQVELWLLDPSGADPSNIASYSPSGVVLTSAGPTTTPFASWPGMLLRCRSGGSAGTSSLTFAALG